MAVKQVTRRLNGADEIDRCYVTVGTLFALGVSLRRERNIFRAKLAHFQRRLRIQSARQEGRTS